MSVSLPHEAAAHKHPELGFIRKYIFSTDHKIIGIQYFITCLIFMMLAGVLALTAYCLVIEAFRFLPIAMVSALRELSSVFAVLIGWLFMNEKLTARRMMACALVTCGAVLIRL